MPPSSKTRTNSLAFAKTDCHTCTVKQRRCDRKRPRCSPCSGNSNVCGGYPIQLTWPKSKPIRPTSSEQTDDPFHLDPLSPQASIYVGDRNNRARPHKPRKFKFVTEQAPGRKQPSTKSCGPRIQQSNMAMDTPTYQSMTGSPLLDTLADGVHADSPGHMNEQGDVSDTCAMLFPADFSSDPHDLWGWSSTPAMDIQNADILSELNNDWNTVAMSSVIDNAAWEYRSPTSSRQNSIGLESPVLHKSLFGKFEALLNMYDQDFCVVPLSGDVSCNPFRCQLETSRGSQSLLHAILAVSCYHASRQARKSECLPSDVVNHQNTAMKLYRDELDTYTGSQAVQLLDTTMLLFLFNATQSAFSSWASRISDVQKLLRLSGGPQIWVDNRRVQAQVVMLLWWDATIALLSRQGCLLPYSYFEDLLALEDDRHWSFFDLIGCPRDLVVPLMQLTSLAEENEKVLSMRWTKFDLTLVDEIQTSITNWNHPAPEIDDISEEKMQQQRDRWNCIEAWRYGLLIYITRVFRWDRKMSPPSRLAIYSRLIFEHVHSCRHTALVQKQALLPLFFAGCETKDQSWRQSIRDYCQYWDKICGYNLFNSACSLLEDVWMEQEGFCGDKVWWGSVIDKKQQPYQSHESPMQFCFG